jgi:hypothetical protein
MRKKMTDQPNYLTDTKKFYDQMLSVISPQLELLVSAISSQEQLSKYYIEIPDPNYVDLTINDIASLVARSSNVYGTTARFAGIARAQYKLLEARYKRVYKANRIGKNEAEREAAAAAAADSEYMALSSVEALVQIAESMELAARIASESARKLMDKMQAMQIASAREEKGFFSEKDFSLY